MRPKKLLAGALGAAMLLTSAVMSPGSCKTRAVMTAEAVSVVSYDMNDYSAFRGRTREEVAEHYSAAMLTGDTYSDGDSSTYYTVPASVTNPYCAGEVTEDTLYAMEAMTDFYRWLVGVDPLEGHSGPNDLLQHQALDRNFHFAHKISQSKKPADMDDALWQIGFEQTHNVLAKNYTPRGAITGWVNEGYKLETASWTETGHRYALLAPKHTMISYAYCGSIAVGQNNTVYGRTYVDTFSSFPAPGPMPAESVAAPTSCWTADWDIGAFGYLSISDVTVTITNTKTGKVFVRSAADDTLTGSEGHLSFVQAEDYDTATGRYTDPYSIVIKGLFDAAGNMAEISYGIDFFNVSDVCTSRVKTVNYYYDTLHIHENLCNKTSLDKIALGLPTALTVQSESGKLFEIPAQGHWVYDEQLNCFRNSADPGSLPSTLIDQSGLLSDIRIGIVKDTDVCKWTYMSTSAGGSIVADATSIDFSVKCYYRNLECASICRVSVTGAEQDGTVRIDTISTPELITDPVGPPLKFSDKIYVSDSGEYFSISYSAETYFKDAYVSREFVRLTAVHRYDNEVTKEPTCTEEGVKTYTCRGCGESYDDPIPALGHDYTEEVIEPGCTVDGCTLHTCTRCGNSYSDNIIPALGHNYVPTVTKATTCTEDGTMTYTCSRCSDSFEHTIKATGHSHVESVVLPSCTEGGYTLHTCSKCGDSYTTDPTEPLGHDYQISDSKEVTCEEDGYTTYTCTRCKDSYTLFTEAFGHQYERTVTEPTCTAFGYTADTCTVCGKKVISDLVPALGHSFVITTVEKTCTVDGCTLHTCERCNASFRENVDPAPGHSYELIDEKEVSCTEDGYKQFRCSSCGDEYTETIHSEGHKYNREVIHATFEAGGYTVCTCEACGDSYITDEVPPLVSIEDAELILTKSRFELTDSFSIMDGDKPGLIVKLDGKELVYEESFTVTYRDAEAPGTATAVVTGIGLYGGSAEITFLLVKTGSAESPVICDADGDGRVTLRDYALLAAWLADPEAELETALFDADNDNKLTANDLALIMAYLTGAKVTF